MKPHPQLPDKMCLTITGGINEGFYYGTYQQLIRMDVYKISIIDPNSKVEIK